MKTKFFEEKFHSFNKKIRIFLFSLKFWKIVSRKLGKNQRVMLKQSSKAKNNEKIFP